VEQIAFLASQERHPTLVAYMMEMGIIFHSVVIGVGLGLASDQHKHNTVKTLLVALCVHQLFEGESLSALLTMSSARVDGQHHQPC
jgi:hypothetical protein